MGDVDARVHIFTATALGSVRMASSTLGRLFPWKVLYSFYRRLSGSQGQSGYERVKIISTLPSSNPGRPVHSQSALPLELSGQENTAVLSD